MAVINLTSEEFANRIEEMLDLASKGDNVLIHHEGKTYTVITQSFVLFSPYCLPV